MPTRNGELPVDLEKAPIPAEQHLPPRTDLTRLTTALDELHGSVIAAIRARERLVGAPSDVVEEKCHLARESLTGLLIERLARDESRALLSTAYGREWMPHGPYWADRDGNSTREARSAVLRGVARSNNYPGVFGTVFVVSRELARFSEECIAAVNDSLIVGARGHLSAEQTAALEAGDELSGYRDLDREIPEIRAARRDELAAYVRSAKSAACRGEVEVPRHLLSEGPAPPAEAAGGSPAQPTWGDGTEIKSEPVGIAETKSTGTVRPSGRRGRKPGQGSINDSNAMEEMLTLLTTRAAVSVSAAAREAAQLSPGNSHTSTARRLRGKFSRLHGTQPPVGSTWADVWGAIVGDKLERN
jgi:hypothetical protein